MKKFFRFLLIIVFVGVIYLAGYAVGHKNIEFEKGFIPKILNTNLGKPSDIDFSLFWEAWDIVKDKFFGQTDQQQMVYGAISGMIKSLQDPYSLFMDPEDSKRFAEDMEGQFDGIGAEIEAKDGRLVIVAPLKDSAAEKAGIKAQDIILKIDNQDVSELTFYQAINKIRGKKGTIVTLNIARSGWEEPKDIKIKRETIVVKSVEYEMKGNIGYLKISQFGDDTLKLVKEATDYFIKKNAQALVIDLRNNPGGYLQDAVDIVSLFIERDKVVVIEKGKEGTETTFKTTLAPKLAEKPLVVLVNGGSASASEIFAGAIQDHQRGKIVGEKTFGKGSVQNLEDLKDGSKVRITIAEWLTPNYREINKKGIEPDITVELTDEDKDKGRDSQLERAIEEVGK